MEKFLFSNFSSFPSQPSCGAGSQLTVVEGLGQGLVNGDCEAIQVPSCGLKIQKEGYQC